jgi:hypothetical protein
MNIVDYAESQMENFKAKKFNLVDSLVLSQFVYIHFNDVVPVLSDNQEPVRIGELLKAEHIPHMLHNEKYIGDALLQKTYTKDVLTKQRVKNNGHVPQY